MLKHGVKKDSCPDESKDLQKLYELEESREKHEKVAIANPNDYQSWNYLKRYILTSENKIEEIKKQMSLSKKAIQENPKSYAAWFHRYFLFERWQDEWFKEHQLCNLLLQFDSRNFHCWNYCLKNKFQIKEDLYNYTSMHFKPYRERVMFIDPNDEAVWNQFEKRRRQEIRGFYGIIRKHPKFFEIIFDQKFNGKIKIKEQIIENKTSTLRIVVNSESFNENTLICFNEKQVQIQEEIIPTVINEILQLEPTCIYALKNKLNYTRDKERKEIRDRLQELDPSRKGYYQYLYENDFKIYILKELK